MCAKYVLKCQKTNISRSIDKFHEIFQDREETILQQNAYQNDNDEEVIFQWGANFGHFECIGPSDRNVLYLFSSRMHRNEKQLIDIILKYLFRLARLVSSILSADISVCFEIID